VENISERDQKGRKWAIFSGVLCHSSQKHNFEMHICGFDFDVVNMEDNSFFLEDRYSTVGRDLKNKKIMVPMNPEGGARTAPRAPRLLYRVYKHLTSCETRLITCLTTGCIV